MLIGIFYQADNAICIGLAENIFTMSLYRSFADEQGFCDLLIVILFFNQPDDFYLTAGKVIKRERMRLVAKYFMEIKGSEHLSC